MLLRSCSHASAVRRPALASRANVVTRALLRSSVISDPGPKRVLQPTYVREATRPDVKRSAAASDGIPSEGAAAEPEGCNFTQSVFNVVNVVMGVGLLSLPYALKSAGWVGLVLLMLMGYIAAYTGKALVECSNAIVKKQKLDVKAVGYEDIGQAAFGKLGRLIVSSMIYCELGGCCAMMFILMGDNMFNLLGQALAKTQAEYMVLGALLMIPTVWLPDLKALSFLGIFGIGATLTVAASVAITLFTGSYTAGAVTHMAVWSSFPLVFGILTICYSGHGVFPSIQASMEKPEEFPKVLNVAYTIVAITCAFIGGAGYYMFGSNAADVIVFNLPAGVLVTLCSCVILINPIAKFAVTMEPVAAALTRKITGGPSLAGLQRIALRTGLSIALLFAASKVPMLALVMSLLGSFLTISISVTMPALCHLVLLKDELTPSQKAWDYFVTALGLLFATLGTMASVATIMAKLQS
eukprot:gene8319-1594_t